MSRGDGGNEFDEDEQGLAGECTRGRLNISYGLFAPNLLSSNTDTSLRLPPFSFLLPFLMPLRKVRLVSTQIASPTSVANRPQSSMRYSFGSLASLGACLRMGDDGRSGVGPV